MTAYPDRNICPKCGAIYESFIGHMCPSYTTRTVPIVRDSDANSIIVDLLRQILDELKRMQKSIILVTGSRNHDPIKVADHICEWVKDYRLLDSERVIIMHGGASGADNGARIACERNPEWGEIRMPARWKTEGKRAGPVRNREMLSIARPSRVLAYPLEDSVGTWDMVHAADFQGIPVHIYQSIL